MTVCFDQGYCCLVCNMKTISIEVSADTLNDNVIRVCDELSRPSDATKAVQVRMVGKL